jgi:AcrR family transcriptional regulator
MSATRVPLKPPAGRKARETYDTLVRATRDELAKTGSFVAEEVATRAGMATATFYAYFSSKDDALAAAFDQVLDENNQRVAEALAIERLLDDGLEAVVRKALTAAIDGFRDNALLFRAAVARVPASKTLRDVYRQREREGLEVITRFLDLATSAGRIQAADRDTLATTLIVVLQGLNNPLVLHRRDDDPVVDQLVTMVEGLLS